MKNVFINQELKILIYETDEKLLLNLESYLQNVALNIITTSDGSAVLDLYKEHTPEILLLCDSINNTNILELVKSVKEIKPQQLIMIMLSDESNYNLFRKLVDLNVDKYLNKPIEKSFLIDSIKTLGGEKLWESEYQAQKKFLQDYKDTIDLSFSVSRHDRDGKIIGVNELFCVTTGLKYADAMKGVINPLQNPNTDMKIVWNALENDYMYRDRQIFQFEGQDDHIIDITAVALFDEKDAVSEYLVFSNDVSEVVHAARKIKAQELDKKLQKLEHIKELNKAKDSFLTVFTHELKTPLNSIINFSEYVKKHLANEEFKKRDKLMYQVSQINSCGWDMLEMISNLIETMKLKEGNVELKYSKFTLNSIIDEALYKKREALSEFKLIKSYCSDGVEVYSDQLRLQQVLNSLVSNAVKYSYTTIAVVLKESKDEFVIEILDDGEGFKDTSKVFNLFEQSDDDSMTRTAKGTGVGLYIVKKICDIMHYNIKLDKSKNFGGARVVLSGKKGT